jgi:hypothetical protein
MKKEKNKLTNLLKLGFFLFGMSLLLWNCEKITETDLEHAHQEMNELKIITLNLEKAKKIPDFMEISNKFKASYLFDNEIVKDDLKLKSKQKDEFTIDFNEFKRIEYEGLISYTFLIKRANIKEEHLTENLVIEKKGNKVRGYIMKYRESSYYQKNNQKYLRTKISKTPYKENLEDVLKKINTNLQAKMSCEYEMIVTPRDCTYHGKFSTNRACWNNRDNNYYDVSVNLVCTDSGSDGGDGFTDFGDPNDSSSGGGGSSSGGGATSPIIPCEDVIHGCDKIPHLKLANDLGITDQAQIDYLENNSILVGEINIFLDNNGSLEATLFAKEIVKAKQSNNYTDLFNLTLFTQNPYNVWKSLSQAEKDLIKQNWSEAYHIFKNRKVAEDATRQKFNKNGVNDKSDAFRHAYYNIINTKVVGIGIAKLFSDAHESETPVKFIKEKEMDLFNNNVGQQSLLGNSNLSLTQLADLIYQKILNGNLRYLKPINYNDPNFIYTHGITINTLLKPTNQ